MSRDDPAAGGTPGAGARRGGRVSFGPTGRAAIAMAVLAVPLVASPLGLGSDRSARTPPAPEPVVVGAPTAERASVVPVSGRPARPVAVPSGLSIPSIALGSGVPEQLGLDSAGRLTAPVDYDRIGWYSGGVKPGEAGPAVIVGHVDSFRGPAVFFRLRELRAGATIVVPRADGRRTTFTVDSVRRYPKDAFPSDEVYGPTANAQIRLITCGGAFDRDVRSYEDNIVVFASVH